MSSPSVNKIKEGQTVTIKKKITPELVQVFGDFSGDHNPIHFDDTFAAGTIFKKRIAHGLIPVSFVSALLTELLGQGNVILNLSLKINAPIYINDELTIRLKVKKINPARSIQLAFFVEREKDVVLLEGETLCVRAF